MAEDTAALTPYVVLREVAQSDLQDEAGLIVLPRGARLFITDETVFESQSGERACRDAAEASKAKGIYTYASVPQRSWDPARYELVETISARRIKA